MNIGIIGAGAMAQAIALNAVHSGHNVMISNTRGAESLSSIARDLQCQAGTPSEVAVFGDVVITAVPLYAAPYLPKEYLKDKVVIDPLNYFPHRDGDISDLKNGVLTTSELLAKYLPDAIIVKAFNSITVEDLRCDARPEGAQDRRAIPLAGDNVAAKLKVAEFIHELGFDTVDAGLLKDSWRFERYRPVYCVALKKEALEKKLFATTRDTWVPDGYWIFNREV